VINITQIFIIFKADQFCIAAIISPGNLIHRYPPWRINIAVARMNMRLSTSTSPSFRRIYIVERNNMLIAVVANVTQDALMSIDPSKIMRRPECPCMGDATTMRPIARTSPNRVRLVCLDYSGRPVGGQNNRKIRQRQAAFRVR
jgi:hypothetical protein